MNGMDMEEQQITAGRRTPVRRFTRVLASVAAAVLVIAGLSAIPATAAGEEEIELPETVSANHLPTPQLNGVAWDLRVRFVHPGTAKRCESWRRRGSGSQ